MLFLEVISTETKKMALQRYNIYLNESDHDYIFEEIEHSDKIEYKTNIKDYGDEE